MGSVFANGREVSGKATPNKSAMAMPSVCLSPPAPPAGPIPIPYPVTAMASDTADGTGSVKIGKKETGKKNGSVYSKCSGNQPATRNFGMDVASHTLEGKTKFQAYSFDVMFEKGGAERFMDITTSNHSNNGVATMISGAEANAAVVGTPDCTEMQAQNEQDFADAKSASEAGSRNNKKTRRAKADDQPGITIAQASVPGGGTRSGTSCSTVRELVPKFSEDPNKPLRKEQRTKVAGKGRYAMDVCPPAGTPDYHHPTGMEHAEIHILNSVSGLGGAARPKLTFAIEWHESYKGERKAVRDDACKVCQKAIAHACTCFSIYICKKNGPEPQCPQDKPAPPTNGTIMG